MACGLIAFAMAAPLVGKNGAALLVKTFDMIGRGPKDLVSMNRSYDYWGLFPEDRPRFLDRPAYSRRPPRADL